MNAFFVQHPLHLHGVRYRIVFLWEYLIHNLSGHRTPSTLYAVQAVQLTTL